MVKGFRCMYGNGGAQGLFYGVVCMRWVASEKLWLVLLKGASFCLCFYCGSTEGAKKGHAVLRIAFFSLAAIGKYQVACYSEDVPRTYFRRIHMNHMANW